MFGGGGDSVVTRWFLNNRGKKEVCESPATQNKNKKRESNPQPVSPAVFQCAAHLSPTSSCFVYLTKKHRSLGCRFPLPFTLTYLLLSLTTCAYMPGVWATQPTPCSRLLRIRDCGGDSLSLPPRQKPKVRRDLRVFGHLIKKPLNV